MGELYPFSDLEPSSQIWRRSSSSPFRTQLRISQLDEVNRTSSSTKSRDVILRPPNWTQSTQLLHCTPLGSLLFIVWFKLISFGQKWSLSSVPVNTWPFRRHLMSFWFPEKFCSLRCYFCCYCFLNTVTWHYATRILCCSKSCSSFYLIVINCVNMSFWFPDKLCSLRPGVFNLF